jgi:hypothetical protein
MCLSARLCVFIPALLLVAAPVQAQERLAELYRTGRITLAPEFVITDEQLPDEVFFVGYEQSWSTSVDKAGNVYFADFGANHIKIFTADGTFSRVMGRHGAGPAEFNTPYFTTISNDRLVVWDMGNTRFCILTLQGELLKTRPLNRGEEGWPWRLQALSNGDILMESERWHPDNPQEMSLRQVRLYSPDLEFKKVLYEHAVQSQKRIENPRSTIPVPFSPRIHWGVSPDDKVVVGFAGEYRIEFHDPETGRLASFEHDRKPARVTAEQRQAWFDGITSSRGGQVVEGASDFIVKNTEFPQFMPAYDQIIVDSDGNILVHASRDDATEELHRYTHYDVFGPDGSFISAVEIIGDGRFPVLCAPVLDGCLFAGEMDEFGVISLIKYRISK